MYSVRAPFSSASCWRVQRATSAQLREATVRAPNSVARAFGIHLQRPWSLADEAAKLYGPHGRKESATSGDLR